MCVCMCEWMCGCVIVKCHEFVKPFLFLSDEKALYGCPLVVIVVISIVMLYYFCLFIMVTIDVVIVLNGVAAVAFVGIIIISIIIIIIMLLLLLLLLVLLLLLLLFQLFLMQLPHLSALLNQLLQIPMHNNNKLMYNHTQTAVHRACSNADWLMSQLTEVIGGLVT